MSVAPWDRTALFSLALRSLGRRVKGVEAGRLPELAPVRPIGAQNLVQELEHVLGRPVVLMLESRVKSDEVCTPRFEDPVLDIWYYSVESLTVSARISDR